MIEKIERVKAIFPVYTKVKKLGKNNPSAISSRGILDY